MAARAKGFRMSVSSLLLYLLLLPATAHGYRAALPMQMLQSSYKVATSCMHICAKTFSFVKPSSHCGSWHSLFDS